jgi:uncharacterized RDD family membrane protein YckC
MIHLPDPDTQPQFYNAVPTKRLIAWVIDTVIVVALCLLILPFTAFTALFFFPLLYLVVGFVYRTVTIANGSATFGMRAMAIEFRTMAGTRFDLTTAALHTFGYTVSIGLPILQVASIIMMLTTARAQGLTDSLLGTAALNRRAAH